MKKRETDKTGDRDSRIRSQEETYSAERKNCEAGRQTVEEHLARQLVEIGCLKGAVLSREEFYAKAEAVDEQQKAAKLGGGGPRFGPQGGAPLQGPLGESPLTQQLAARLELIRRGALSSVAFVRDVNEKGHEVSGYIDLAERIKTAEYQACMAGTKKLLPRPGDLSYYNWKTGRCVSRDSSDFCVVYADLEGLLFRHKKDRKLLNPSPEAPHAGDNSQRVDVQTPELQQLAFLDHTCRRKC
ncbi:hypothetical protein Efla_007718 [Eimeria flavescens]